jgi:hypothetical protein
MKIRLRNKRCETIAGSSPAPYNICVGVAELEDASSQDG